LKICQFEVLTRLGWNVVAVYVDNDISTGLPPLLTGSSRPGHAKGAGSPVAADADNRRRVAGLPGTGTVLAAPARPRR
jgi:hypothetical protein